ALSEPPPEPDPLTEGKDWIRSKEGYVHHPLEYRCLESAIQYWHDVKKLGLDPNADDDLDDFLFEFQTTGVKLGGALGPIADGNNAFDRPSRCVYLRRPLDHLHKPKQSREALASKHLLPEKMVADARRELLEIREAILKLMDEYRRRH